MSRPVLASSWIMYWETLQEVVRSTLPGEMVNFRLRFISGSPMTDTDRVLLAQLAINLIPEEANMYIGAGHFFIDFTRVNLHSYSVHRLFYVLYSCTAEFVNR